jgi:hypothetical protein
MWTGRLHANPSSCLDDMFGNRYANQLPPTSPCCRPTGGCSRTVNYVDWRKNMDTGCIYVFSGFGCWDSQLGRLYNTFLQYSRLILRCNCVDICRLETNDQVAFKRDLGHGTPQSKEWVDAETGLVRWGIEGPQGWPLFEWDVAGETEESLVPHS